LNRLRRGAGDENRMENVENSNEDQKHKHNQKRNQNQSQGHNDQYDDCSEEERMDGGKKLDESDRIVECILSHKTDSRSDGSIVKSYLIKWLGYGDEHNVWLLQSNLDCPDKVREYDERWKQKTSTLL